MEVSSLLKPKSHDDDTPPVVEKVVWKEYNFKEDSHTEFPLTVKNQLTEKQYEILICNANTVYQLKERIYKESNDKPENQRLFFMSKELEDGRTIADYNMTAKCSIILTLRNRGGCFFPNTLVTLSDGSEKEIRKIVPNDSVLAFNLETHSYQSCIVRKLLRYQIDEIAELKTSTGKSISTSFTHPFWVPGKGWKVAVPDYKSGVPRLQIGDQFLSSNSEIVTLVEIETRILESPQEVFTLSLDEVHTFFVHGVLVHNSQIFVKNPMGKTVPIEAEPTDTIATIKKRISKIFNIQDYQQNLLYGPFTLDNSKTLKDYDIQKESTIILAVDMKAKKPENSLGYIFGDPKITLEAFESSEVVFYVLYERKRNEFKMSFKAEVSELKGEITKRLGIHASQQILVHNGNVLVEGTLSSCGFAENDEVMLIPYSRGGSTLKFMYSVATKQMSQLDELEEGLSFLGRTEVRQIMSEIRTLVAKRKSNPQWKNSNEVGIASIILWTTDYVYRACNKALNEDKNVERWRKFLNGLVWGLRELPPYQGKGYRGFKDFRDLSEYSIGAIVCWKNISAISKNLEVAKKFSNDKGIIFEVEVLSGRDISGISKYQSEDEVLLFPYSHFQVVGVIDHNGQPAYVKLREVPVPQSPKIVLWVDDHPENNTKWVQELFRRGVSVLFSTNTKEALALLNTYSWMLQLNDGDIRIVTDMVRDEIQGDKKVTNYVAGIDFIRELRNTYAFGHKVMIFCKDEEAARKNCENEKLGKENIIVNASEKKLETFLHFLALDSKIPASKPDWTCNLQ